MLPVPFRIATGTTGRSALPFAAEQPTAVAEPSTKPTSLKAAATAVMRIIPAEITSFLEPTHP